MKTFILFFTLAAVGLNLDHRVNHFRPILADVTPTVHARPFSWPLYLITLFIVVVGCVVLRPFFTKRSK